MSTNLITDLTSANLRSDVPAFRAGDTIKVHVKVVEGNRSRVQIFQGVVIRLHGSGIDRTFQIIARQVQPQETAIWVSLRLAASAQILVKCDLRLAKPTR